MNIRETIGFVAFVLVGIFLVYVAAYLFAKSVDGDTYTQFAKTCDARENVVVYNGAFYECRSKGKTQ